MSRCTLVLLAALLLGAASCVRPEPARAATHVTVDVGVFYDSLSPYGHWFSVPTYGWVFVPYGMAVEWRPYTHGRWVWSQYGWTWVSDWDWGWACFHYGRWAFTGSIGWFWVPGDVWGPAWVAWRHGGGYVGWAPLPPRVRYVHGHGLSAHGADVDPYVDEDAWVFVPERQVLEPEVHVKVAAPERNKEIIERTRNVTRFETIDGRPRNVGPEVAAIEHAARREVPRYKVTDVVSPEARKQPPARAHELGMFRPAVPRGTGKPPARREDVTRRTPAESTGDRQLEREAPARGQDVRPATRPPETRPTEPEAPRRDVRPATRPDDPRQFEREAPVRGQDVRPGARPPETRPEPPAPARKPQVPTPDVRKPRPAVDPQKRSQEERRDAWKKRTEDRSRALQERQARERQVPRVVAPEVQKKRQDAEKKRFEKQRDRQRKLLENWDRQEQKGRVPPGRYR